MLGEEIEFVHNSAGLQKSKFSNSKPIVSESEILTDETPQLAKSKLLYATQNKR